MNQITLARYLQSFLQPLSTAAADKNEEARLLARMGYAAPPDVSFFGSLKSVIQVGIDAAELLAEEEGSDSGAAARLVGDIIDAVQSVSNTITNLEASLSPGAAGSSLVTDTDFLETLPRKLFDLLLIDFLSREAPGTLGMLRVLSIVRLEPIRVIGDPNRVSHVSAFVAWERLPTLVSDPRGELKTYYGWGTAGGIDVPLLFESLRILAMAVGLRAEYRGITPTARQMIDQAVGVTGRVQQGDDPVLLRLPVFPIPNSEIGVDVYPIENPADGTITGLALDAFADAAASITIQASENVRLDAHLGGHVSGFGILVRPDAPVTVMTSVTSADPQQIFNNIALDADLGITFESSRGLPLVLLGTNSSTRLQIASMAARVATKKEQTSPDIDFLIEASVTKAAIVIKTSDGDGFLAKVLPKDGVKIDFDFLIGFSTLSGVYLGASGGLEISLAVNTTLFGIITVDAAYLSIRAETTNGKTRVGAGATATINLNIGPLAATIEKLGIQARLTSTDTAGNLGAMDFGIGFQPPRGIGLALKTGPVRGGGYLFMDPEAGQYAGVLQLEFSAIALKAIGILTTKMPDGSEGFSLLIIITAEFTPIQLGFGFTLSGVGGLIGINRKMELEPLRDGIKQHTLDSILFPKDPVANVNRIIGDLKTVFPPAEGRFTFGLMAKLGWGSPAVLTAEIGIIIELMAPVRLAILGKFQLVLPEDNKDAIVKLHLDVLGTLDFAKCELGIDAVLYDSRIAIFDISGGMALRVSWGASPAFALSVGGFNPRFAAPPGFPIVDRLAISLATGNNPRVRLESYLAVTSNTVQIGAKFEVFAEAKFLGTWTVNAYLGFDALIYLSPFHFIVDVYGGACLKYNGNPFLSLDLFLSVSGPGQWIVHGRAVFDFFGKHSIAVDCTIGKPDPPAPLPIANPLEDLKVAIEDPRSWSAQLPDIGQMLVTLREIDAPGMVLVHPLGQLTVRERVVPLEIEITHYGASDPGANRRFAIDSVKLGNDGDDLTVSGASQIREKFAPGQFFDLTEDQKLSGPEFEPLPAGLTGIGSVAITSGAAAAATFDYETLVIDVIQPAPLRGLKYAARDDVVLVLAKSSAAGQAPARRDGAGGFRGPAKGIKVHEPSYSIAGKRNLSTAAGTTEYASRTEGAAALGVHVRRNELQVVGAHEEAA